MEPGDRRLTAEPPRHLVVGRIARAHSVYGEVRVEVLTDFPERRFAVGSRLSLGDESARALTPAVVRSVRPHKGYLLVRFDVAPDRTAAEALNGLLVFGDASDAPDLGPDAYYHHQLVGCGVSTVDGTALGDVVEIIETGTADVLRIRDGTSGRDVLVPMIGDVIRRIDVDARTITIEPLPGLLD